jgi:hypothetical protein
MGIVDLAPATATGRSDVWAVYGGLELGLGIFCTICTRQPVWARAGLTAQAFTLGSLVIGRLVSLRVDRPPELRALLFGAGELAVDLLAVVALRSVPRSPETAAG